MNLYNHGLIVFSACSVLGSLLIVAGLYSVLWGKYKENKEKKEMERMSLPLAALEGIEGNGQLMDIIEVDEVQLEKVKSNNKITSSTQCQRSP